MVLKHFKIWHWKDNNNISFILIGKVIINRYKFKINIGVLLMGNKLIKILIKINVIVKVIIIVKVVRIIVKIT
jgi:hypothetical protein